MIDVDSLKLAWACYKDRREGDERLDVSAWLAIRDAAHKEVDDWVVRHDAEVVAAFGGVRNAE